jgi:HSP20 family protein
MSNQQFNQNDPLKSLRDSVNKMLDDGLSAINNAINSTLSAVPVDIYETETAVIVKVGPLVGIDPNAIDVSITGDNLTIKGVIQDDEPNQTVLRRERKLGPFSRTVKIPRPVRGDQAEADYKNSMLTIQLPKVEEPQPKVINVRQVDS